MPFTSDAFLPRRRKFARLLALFLTLVAAGFALELDERVGPVDLVTLDGRPLTVSNYAERKGTVIVFASTRSGPTKAASQTIAETSQRLRRNGILFVGIFPHEHESADEVRKFTHAEGWLFPIYRTSASNVVAEFGASVTPEFFLLDRDSRLVYHGALGGSEGPGLAAALTALLDDQPVKVAHLAPTGTPIGQSTPPRNIVDPFVSVAFSSELIFEKIPDVSAHHCSTIVEAANGDLLIAWYGGSYESADDQTLFLTRRKKGERTWSAPEVLIRDSARPPGNAVLFRDARDRLWIVWCRMEASRPLRRGGGWSETRLFYRTSDDHGMTWSQDEPFLDGLTDGLRNVPITLKSGEVLLPLDHNFARSSDAGQTWQRFDGTGDGLQPTVIERDDGSLLALLRQGPRILQSESHDRGQTWTTPSPTSLRNPGGGIAMTRLRHGTVILIFNDSESERTPLCIVRSLDEGRTWETPLTLESNPGEYSYPCVIQTSDGRIHVTYTYRRYSIKHVELDENWLIHLKRPN